MKNIAIVLALFVGASCYGANTLGGPTLSPIQGGSNGVPINISGNAQTAVMAGIATNAMVFSSAPLSTVITGFLETNVPATITVIGDSMGSPNFMLLNANQVSGLASTMVDFEQLVKAIYGDGGKVGSLWSTNYNTSKFFPADTGLGSRSGWYAIDYSFMEWFPILTNGESARFVQGGSDSPLCPTGLVNQVIVGWLNHTTGTNLVINITNEFQTVQVTVSTLSADSETVPTYGFTNIAVATSRYQQVYVSTAVGGTNLVYISGLVNTNIGVRFAYYARGSQGYGDIYPNSFSGSTLQSIINTNFNPSLILWANKHLDGSYDTAFKLTNLMSLFVGHGANNGVITQPAQNLSGGADNSTENTIITQCVAGMGGATNGIYVLDLATQYSSWGAVHPSPGQAAVSANIIYLLCGLSPSPFNVVRSLQNVANLTPGNTSSSNNWVGSFTGNGSGVTNIAGTNINFQAISTNFISGQPYTNFYGATIQVSATVTYTTAAVNGDASITLLTTATASNGGRTNSIGTSTTVAVSLAQVYTNQISIFVPTNAPYWFTNGSQGAGNASSILGGQIMVY